MSVEKHSEVSMPSRSTGRDSGSRRSMTDGRDLSAITDFLSGNPMSASGKIAAYTGLDPARISVLCKRLQMQGKVKVEGIKRGTRYSLV